MENYLHLNHTQGVSRDGVFQGDSLSSLLLCLALVPFLTSSIWNWSQIIHLWIENKSSILNGWFKIGKNDEELERLLSTVKIFSDYMGIEFNLHKSVKVTFVRGRSTSTSKIKQDIRDSTSIRKLDW